MVRRHQDSRSRVHPCIHTWTGRLHRHELVPPPECPVVVLNMAQARAHIIIQRGHGEVTSMCARRNNEYLKLFRAKDSHLLVIPNCELSTSQGSNKHAIARMHELEAGNDALRPLPSLDCARMACVRHNVFKICMAGNPCRLQVWLLA